MIKPSSHPTENQRSLFGLADASASEEPAMAKRAPRSGGSGKAGKSAKSTAASRAPKPAGAASGRRRKAGETKAHEMAAKQREISVSEFFAKNRHLLGFDSKRKALLTTVKEAVDNALDACEEAELLPTVHVIIEQVKNKEDRYRVTVGDYGPGIVNEQIDLVFAKLLYGSKFHRLRQSRGQQGIGISAAGMYGQMTTGQPTLIRSRIGRKHDAHELNVRIDTVHNRPVRSGEKVFEWDRDHGTEVVIELEAKYHKGRGSVDDYIAQTAIANPHVELLYWAPGEDKPLVYQRATQDRLSAARRERLGDVEGWEWDPRAADWEAGFAALTAYVQAEGHARVPQSYRTAEDYRLGSWVSKQHARQDRLSAGRRRRLKALKGWVWKAV